MVEYRFLPVPTPEELVSDFPNKKRCDPAYTDPRIGEVDIYKHHPRELPGLSPIQSDEQVWHFSCTLNYKYAKSERANRKAIGGSWKITTQDRDVMAKHSNKRIGFKKTLTFYQGCNFRKENRTNWIMHEYHEYRRDEDPHSKDKLVVCRIELKPDKKRKRSSSLDEGKSSNSLAYDSPNSAAQDIPEVECHLPQNLHLPSSSNNDVANNNLMEVEPQLLPNQHISHATKNIFPWLGSQQLPNQHISSSGEYHVAKYNFPESESQLLPNQHMSPIIGDHVANAKLSQSESQSLLPNYPVSSTIEGHTTNNGSFEIISQLLPNHQHLSSYIENHAAKGILSETRPLVPGQQDELIDCNGLYQKSFTTLQLPMYPTPGSHLLDHNSFSALHSPIHLPPGSSYSSSFGNISTKGLLDHSSFSTLQSPIHPHPGSSDSSGFSNDSTNGLDHNCFSTPQPLIHPQPGSSDSTGFSNDSTNVLDHYSFSALESPICPQPGSSHSSGISNGSNVWNTQFAAEQEDDLANSHWSVLDQMISLHQKLDTLILQTSTHKWQSQEVMLVMEVMQSLKLSLQHQMSILQGLNKDIQPAQMGRVLSRL